MGIKNLHTFLRKTCPFIYEEISLTSLAYKKIAIDLSIYLCKYKSIYKEKWIDAFLNLVTCLRENEIHFVFIFDSKSPPEKDAEKQFRLLQRLKLKKKIEDLERSVKYYNDKNEIDDVLRFYFEKKATTDITIIYNEIDRLKSNVIDIKSDDFELIKHLFDLLDVPYYYAVSEAEATCAHLCINKQVDGVLTEDTDILAYGCPIFYHKINIQNNTIMKIEIKNILQMLHFTFEQFRDFCIMCGTDYNTNLPKIGAERAFRYIKEYKCIENIEQFHDVSILKYHRVRELFQNDIIFEIPNTYCGKPKEKELKLFCFTHNCFFDLNKLFHSFLTGPDLIFI
jgi:5'-3' exonuclease